MSRARKRPTVERARDFPRPPVIQSSDHLVVVRFADEIVAQSSRALRVLERDHAPGYFIPRDDIRTDLLVPSDTHTWCEWKGRARFFSIEIDHELAPDAAFHFPRPLPEYRKLRGHIGFFPDRVDSCHVDGEICHSQPGGYYPGWVTDQVEGPFRGLMRLQAW